MRTPLVLVAGQGDTHGVAATLLRNPGTVVVGHGFDGQVIRRWVTSTRDGRPSTTEMALELTHGCISCTIRNDLLVLIRRLHRRAGVQRIVVLAPPWLEPEPICWAVNNVRVRVGPGVDSANWLSQALGDDELDDQRTVAQVVVGQAEFADVLVLTEPERRTIAVLRRLAPRSRITVGRDRIEMSLRHLEPGARRGRKTGPHDWLLAGEPPLAADGDVALIEFGASRPFHPERLHCAIDLLLDGVVRVRGRAWLATQPDTVVWMESAGGGLRVSNAGRWLAAMTASEVAYVDPERRAMARLAWHPEFGDRHVSLTVLICGADSATVGAALRDALVTDEELARRDEWTGYRDPFGDWHQDPCTELVEGSEELSVRGRHQADGDE
jgi:G3E family GTPase